MESVKNQLASTVDHASGNTRERILDAAEALFVQHGFAATSLRAIATTGGVNLAATNYHFGSKMGLFAAVFHRRIKPINEERLLLLKDLKESDRPLTTRTILEAFYQPVTNAVTAGRAPAVMGRLFGEPEEITKPILEKEFSEVAMSFQAALARVLPHLEEEELRWRFHFTVGSMVHLLLFQTPLGSDSSASRFTEGMDSLINYAVAALEQGYNGNSHD
jgi:AcrR family transcriptional regulator